MKKLLHFSYQQAAQIFFFILALLALALGILGIILPGLPTTPFILLAAWAATKSSPRLQNWLERHPLFGALILDWKNGHTVKRKAKWAATLMMCLCGIILTLWVSQLWIILLAISCMTATLTWLWLRPEPENKSV